MKDTIDQEDEVIVARRALDIAARRGRQVVDVFNRQSIIRW